MIESTKKLTGRRVLITAGPTQEAIDPVRYISNASSGKMGYALASAARDAGATVTLISGPVNLTAPANVECIFVVSALEMQQAVMAQVDTCDIFIGVAAVADYRCKSIASQKIKKGDNELHLVLTQNPDIITEVAALANRPFVVGFAAETDNVEAQAKLKLTKKKLDMIIANPVGQAEVGIGSDDNSVTVIWQGGQQVFPRSAKTLLAQQLMTLIANEFHKKN